MNIVFFSHPMFFASQSMPRFVQMLARGMEGRGWKVEIWSPRPLLVRVPASPVIRKWLGYVDQYVFFPFAVRNKLKACDASTLFVVTDQALGIWVPLVAERPHVVHCHDFLAQLSANGNIQENRTAWSGRQYQFMIRRGYARARHFISVSKKTREDLHSFLPFTPHHSEVVYNGFHQQFEPQDRTVARRLFSAEVKLDLKEGYILHVGGNQWNKNRPGVIEIYNAWRLDDDNCLPLVLVGETPDSRLRKAYESSPYRKDIHLVVHVADALLPTAYAGASVFLFPSIAEGFGWPIAEAMACGCPVITTYASPMTEVATHAAFYIPVRPFKDDKSIWAAQSASVLDDVLRMPSLKRAEVIQKGLLNARRFETEASLDRIEGIYREVIRFCKNEVTKGSCKVSTAET